MLRTQSLHFQYDSTTQFHFPDIELSAGANLLVLGESGIGKTTLIHLIAGLLKPGSGSIELHGTVLNELSSARLDRFRGQHIGLVFQRPHFMQSLSLRDNLKLVQHLGGQKPNEGRVSSVLEHLGIQHKRHSRPNQLSQGEQQRAAIALAVVNSPRLILADEPTSSLDDKNCAKVIHLLSDQAQLTDAALVIITHDQRLKGKFQKEITL